MHRHTHQRCAHTVPTPIWNGFHLSANGCNEGLGEFEGSSVRQSRRGQARSPSHYSWAYCSRTDHTVPDIMIPELGTTEPPSGSVEIAKRETFAPPKSNCAWRGDRPSSPIETGWPAIKAQS